MRLTLFAALTLIVPGHAAGPNAPFRQDATQVAPTIHVYSRETLVDVTVTDAQGHPIRNLTPSDFAITEDGVPQSLRSFREFGKNVPTVAPINLPKLPPNTYSNFQPATGPLNVLMLDYINGGRVSVTQAARLVKSLPADSQFAVVALGMRFTVLQGPTTDPSLLPKAVAKPVEPFATMADPCGTQSAINWATLEQLDQVAQYLSGIQGRKNLLWVGTGIPTIIFPDANPKQPLCLQDFKAALRKTYEVLSDAEVTVYPVDPVGVASLGVRQLAMEAVAEATGGVAYYETNDFTASLARAIDNGSSYYTLSYVPPNGKYDGRHHAINAKVDRPGVHLTYRNQYYADDPTVLAHTTASVLAARPAPAHAERPGNAAPPDTLAAALAPTMPPATQLLFNVRATPAAEPPLPSDPPLIGNLNPKLRNRPLTRYDLLFALPTDQITFNPATAGVYNGSLEFDVAAFDPDGNLVTARSQTLKLPLTNAEYRDFIATPFQFFQQLDLPPGRFTLRVGILDSVSNKIGTLDIPVSISK